MSRQTYREVVDAVRAITVDPEGTVFKDSVLLQMVDLAQRKVHMSLAVTGGGSGLFLTSSTTDLDTVATTQLYIDWTTTDPLPDDLIIPLKLWEKMVGATDDTFSEMLQVSRLSPGTQTETLGEWTWENAQIRFTGATVARTVRLEYIKLLPKVTDLSDDLPIPAEGDAMVYFTAHLCALARGSLEQAAAVKAEADYALYLLSNLNQKSAQEGATRRLPYSSIVPTWG